jgi:hypothetical protein
MAQRRWECPRCESGLLAPGRMRRDDTRRFCLSCSAKTGRLVERVCPALERQREQAKTERTARATAQRAKQRDRWLVSLVDAGGVERQLDVRAELRRALTDMGYFNGWARGHKPTMDDLSVTIRRGGKRYHTGRAVIAGFRVWFTFGSGASYESGMKVVYHEAAHLASPIDSGHDAQFHRILAEALQKRWPWIVYGSVNPRQQGGCWAMGQRVVDQMEARVRDGGSLA